MRTVAVAAAAAVAYAYGDGAALRRLKEAERWLYEKAPPPSTWEVTSKRDLAPSSKWSDLSSGNSKRVRATTYASRPVVVTEARAKELDAQIIEAQEQLEHVQRERERYLERFKSLTLCFNGTRHMSSLGSAHDVEEGLGAPEQPEVDGRATSTEASEMAGDIGTLDDRSPAKQGTPRIGDSPLPIRRAEPEAPAAALERRHSPGWPARRR